MPGDLVPRRTQFSSCDACRKSRVACDAMRGRPGSTNIERLGSCTRCANRNRNCTFEWMDRAANSSIRRTTASSARRQQLPSLPQAFSPTPGGFNLAQGQSSPSSSSLTGRGDENGYESGWHSGSPPSTPSQIVTPELADWLLSIYEGVFEAVYGSWLGNYSCPYVFGEHGAENRFTDQSRLALSVSISSLCGKFDQWMKDVEGRGTGILNEHRTPDNMAEKEREIDRSLSQAIQAFSARWLPLTFESRSLKAAHTQLVEHLWREVRRDLLKVINRPCYRSMLTLFLFAMTPIPVGIQEEEECNGIPAQFCVQAALQQVQHLRARQRSLEFNGSKVSPLPDVVAIASTPDQITNDFMGIESIIYWGALTFDTSSSLTFNTKSLLSSGLLGWESESSWRLVRTCTNMFHEDTEEWRLHGLNVTDENANRIVAAAAAWKLLVWKVAAVFKEALREGREEDAVQRVFVVTIDAVEQFNVTYRPLLVACERRIQFLSQHTKLRWYELMMHYHLSILIMIDAIEIAGRTDILEKLSVIRSETEGSVMNCLVFGLNNYFSIPRRGKEPPPGTDSGDMQENSITVPLIAIDPYPHHVVAGVQLLWKAMERDYETGKDQGTFENLQSILLRTLELLPQTSKSVRNAKEQAQLSSVRLRCGSRS